MFLFRYRQMIEGLIFRQLIEKNSSTYTYILADSNTKDGVLIDPVLETAERDAKLIQELGLNIKFALNTHCHAGMFYAMVSILIIFLLN